MTESRFDMVFATTPGTGAICTTPDGREVLYFYEDFDGEGTGIDRAMAQLYPMLRKGVYSKIAFVAKPKI